MNPVKVSILWHMHQPNYQQPGSNRLVLPWVRLHAIKDYLDMPLLASEFDNLKITFNLVPALLDQLQLYIDGSNDRHLELTRIKAEELSDELRLEILNSFFMANPPHMIDPYDRYRELYQKINNNSDETILPILFSSEEIRDLQVWSNLAWVDPLFENEEPIRSLKAKGRHFTEDEKQSLLKWQIELIKKIIPTYQKLFSEDKIDISFTPYYHPILPLLCDTDSAKEALPGITLPEKRFVHPEDAEKQIAMSMERFESLFGHPMKGMWPSEGSISEEVAQLCINKGIKWIATDEEILFNSLKKSGLPIENNPLHTVYEYGSGLKLFFRDHALSDRIGFVYSSWDADKAVDDFLMHLKNIGKMLQKHNDNTVIPVILDGENAWEYYPNDGMDFLRKLYGKLAEDKDIQTVTMTEAAENITPRKLPKLFSGSWINHNFRIWIGHPEDNKAWDLLSNTRDTLEGVQENNPDISSESIKDAWKQIYIAEGSDWCWWYGDEHRGDYNGEFDKIFRQHLIAVYQLLDLEIPLELYTPIYRKQAITHIVQPDALIKPKIDGRMTHFYEWAGAGSFDCVEAGNTMHRADQIVKKIHFGYSHDNFYIRLDFINKKSLKSIKDPMLQITLFAPEPVHFDVSLESAAKEISVNENIYRVAFDEILELEIKRSFVFDSGFGDLGMSLSIFDGDALLEKWPEDEPLKFKMYEVNGELFWPF